MSHTKCVYHNCNRTSRETAMFSFPVKDPDRMFLWIRNSGNIHLDSLTIEELRCRYICAHHFPPSRIHRGKVRSRLLGPAVPFHFESDEVREGGSAKPPRGSEPQQPSLTFDPSKVKATYSRTPPVAFVKIELPHTQMEETEGPLLPEDQEITFHVKKEKET